MNSYGEFPEPRQNYPVFLCPWTWPLHPVKPVAAAGESRESILQEALDGSHLELAGSLRASELAWPWAPGMGVGS